MTETLAGFHAHPVFLSDRSMDKFYHGFCNKTIWPLFHYFPSYAVCEESLYAHYRCVNRIFCEAVARLVQPEDVVWIHDYHLMLLPQLLRQQKPAATIGFFLHIPFPSFEIFRLLPQTWRAEILEGLLGADLIGFHTYDYTQHFLRSVLRVLGHEHTMGKILLPNHLAKVDTFPMGVDFQKFQAAARRQVHGTDDISGETLKDLKVVLSVDRLDYTKGILKRLQGYELFLERNPQWQKKVVLVLVVVPSRIGVDQYQEIKRQIDELVGQINGKFGSVGWTPVLYQYRYLPFEPLVSLYASSHVALVTPLRDGMNLVAKEYLASRTDKTGVLIVSEMTGASKELAEAISINPNNVGEIAAALGTALAMPEPEQIRRNEIMQDRLRRYNVIRWAEDFLGRLQEVKAEQKRLRAKLLRRDARQRLLERLRRAPHSTIFLDYDGTLVSFADDPKDARPTAGSPDAPADAFPGRQYRCRPHQRPGQGHDGRLVCGPGCVAGGGARGVDQGQEPALAAGQAAGQRLEARAPAHPPDLCGPAPGRLCGGKAVFHRVALPSRRPGAGLHARQGVGGRPGEFHGQYRRPGSAGGQGGGGPVRGHQQGHRRAVLPAQGRLGFPAGDRR